MADARNPADAERDIGARTKMVHEATFSIGELVHHKAFDYRGVVVDVDPTFDLSEEWYQEVARSRPPVAAGADTVAVPLQATPAGCVVRFLSLSDQPLASPSWV